MLIKVGSRTTPILWNHQGTLFVESSFLDSPNRQMGNRKSPVHYMNHFHLIYTPKGLTGDLRHYVTRLDQISLRYLITEEQGSGPNGYHYHLYIESIYSKDTISDDLKRIMSIPQGQKGKRSLHYSNRSIDEHPENYPQQDLRKFTLGYIQKEGVYYDHKGYTQEELSESKAYYLTETAKKTQYQAPTTTLEELTQKTEKLSIADEWLEYEIFMDKAIKQISVTDQVELKVEWFKSQNRKYWRKYYPLPQSHKWKRFLASIIDKYRARLRIDDRLAVMKDCGYL